MKKEEVIRFELNKLQKTEQNPPNVRDLGTHYSEESLERAIQDDLRNFFLHEESTTVH